MSQMPVNLDKDTWDAQKLLSCRKLDFSAEDNNSYRKNLARKISKTLNNATFVPQIEGCLSDILATASTFL